MRNWSNAVFHGTLEEACARVPQSPYVERIGLEVEGLDERAGERYVLFPKYDPGLPPWTGDVVRCSDLSFGPTYWRVVRVAKGYPGKMVIGRYPDDFPEGKAIAEALRHVVIDEDGDED